MRIFNKFRGTKGFLYAYERLVSLLHMRNEAEVRRRAKILTFWKEHGTKATKDAFGTSTRTLYRWQRSLNHNQGKLTALDPRNRAPKGRRKRVVDYRIEEWLIEQRTLHPRIGKEKLAVLITPFCTKHSLPIPKETTIGRLLSDIKKKGLLPKYQKVSVDARTGKVHERSHIRRRKLRRPPGVRVVQVDTIVRYIHGVKRYIITAVDTETKYAFACIYHSHSSRSAADFLMRYLDQAPVPALQTDNGSEFEGDFLCAARELDIIHYNTYPRCPKMNAHVERFNRTVSEEFLDQHLTLIAVDVETGNEKLEAYLQWYNMIRPHHSLSLLSPVQYILSLLPGSAK